MSPTFATTGSLHFILLVYFMERVVVTLATVSGA